MDYFMHPRGGGPGQGGGPGYFMDGPHHGGPGPLAWTLFALELVAIIGIVWLVASSFLYRGRRKFLFRHAPGPWGPPGGGAVALDLLQLRYARGEIGRAEYLQARDDLGAPPESPPPPPAAPTSA